MFFISFHCPQLFYCPPCPNPDRASLNMHAVPRNLAKTLVASLNMTSGCDVTNSVYPVTMNTIRHCSILEFGSGASNQAVAAGITKPLHDTAAEEPHFCCFEVFPGLCCYFPGFTAVHEYWPHEAFQKSCF